MGKVVVDISISLDGFVAAANRTPDQPLGVDGERLHDWVTDADPEGGRLLAAEAPRLGAIVSGRRTYDDSVRGWRANGPTGSLRRPLFVVTHEAPASSPDGGVYTFVTDGIDSALRQAREAAGDLDVAVMGGADVARQVLTAGLADQIGIHLVPVLFGQGLRLFEDMGLGHVALAVADAVRTGTAVHMRFDVLGPDSPA